MSSHSPSLQSPPLWCFDYQPRTRLIFGANSVEQIVDVARTLNGTRVLLVTDAGLVKAGHAPRVESLLCNAGLHTTVFDQVRENPTTRDVEECLKVARAAAIDLLVGLGGGSAMDTAKGCNFLMTNGGRMQDYWGVEKAPKPMLPFIAIPTTAGTGSECQSAALIADEKTHQKMACLDPKAMARAAILDPSLTLSQPPTVTAHTGIDAIAHALETAVTTRRTQLSLMFSHESFKLTVPSLPRVFAEPSDVAARGRMLLGAALAGTAIENSMLGAAHAAANPLTARYGIVHGEAVGVMLPAVVRFNAAIPEIKRAYAELASAPELACVSEGLDQAVEALLARLDSLLDTAQIPPGLSDMGVKRSDLDDLAQHAATQWTANFNPRPTTPADFKSLYETAFHPRNSAP